MGRVADEDHLPRFSSVDLRWLFAVVALVVGFMGPALLRLDGVIRALALGALGVVALILVVATLIYVFRRDV